MPAMPSSQRSRGRGGPRLVVALAVLGILVAVAWMAVRVGNPFPDRTLVMATGPEGSASHEFGARYRQALQRAGVDLRLLRTEGGFENLARLRDPRSGVSVAFVESGVTSREESPDLVSLGTVGVQVLWTFFRGQLQGTVAQLLEGKRISIEPEGSATRVVARRIMALNGVDTTRVELLGLTPEQSAEALLRGEIDGATMLTSWQSPAVRRLLVADGIVLESFPRADAYVALFPSLSKVVLPTGVADLARNIPPAPVQLLAVEASLVVRKDLHPALQFLLLDAASEVHGAPDIFHRSGQFPAPKVFDLPLSDQAREYYKSGRPFVYRNLPFWLAGLVQQLLIVLIPLFAIVYPVAQLLPRIYAYAIQRRIFSLYGELKILEMELATAGSDVTNDLAAALEELARRANRLRVPLGFAQRLFILKSHIALTQQEVEKRRRSGD